MSVTAQASQETKLSKTQLPAAVDLNEKEADVANISVWQRHWKTIYSDVKDVFGRIDKVFSAWIPNISST